MSLENLQTLSKLKRNMRAQLFFKQNMHAATQKKLCTHICFWVWKDFGDSPNSFFIFCFFWKNDIKQRFLCEFGVSLEILQTLSKLSPNSYVFFVILFFLWKIGMSLERVWRFSKLTPNSPQTRSKLKGFHFSILPFFLEKRNEFGASLESLQTLSKLSPNRLQTHVSFGNVTTEKTASPGSPAKLS